MSERQNVVCIRSISGGLTFIKGCHEFNQNDFLFVDEVISFSDIEVHLQMNAFKFMSEDVEA